VRIGTTPEVRSTNNYYSAASLASLPIQPQCDDLAQLRGSTKYIVEGGMHPAWEDSRFEYLFNSPSDGELGIGSPNSSLPGHHEVILWDSIQNATVLSMEMNCDFVSPQIIREIRVFSKAGDSRLFTYGEVFYSSTGNNESDYTYLGAVSFGEWGDLSSGYINSDCVAQLHNNIDGFLATNVTSIKIKFIGVMDTTWINTQQKYLGAGGGSVIGEVDIIGIPEITSINEYYSEPLIADLPFQPQCDDLAQMAGSTKYIVQGGMHSAWTDNRFEYLFNSPSDGELGIGSPDSSLPGHHEVILWDSDVSSLTMEMNCDFTVPKEIREVRVFSKAGDTRLFTYGEVYYSTTGTNISDYTYLGAVSFGEWGDWYTNYYGSNCVARLYNNVDGSLAANVTSLKIKFLGVIDTTWANWQYKYQGSKGGSVIGEIDIIGVPEPYLFLFTGLTLLLLRRK